MIQNQVKMSHFNKFSITFKATWLGLGEDHGIGYNIAFHNVNHRKLQMSGSQIFTQQ